MMAQKEPQEQDNYRKSSSKKCNWFWASVEVHIQNSEWNNLKEVHERGNTKNKIKNLVMLYGWIHYVYFS